MSTEVSATTLSPKAARGRWFAVGAIALSMLAVGLDTTVLNIALPTMSTSLHASTSDLQWFSTGYTLVMAAMLLPAGLLGDRFGRKKLMLVSLIVFGASSAWCAYSGTTGTLLTARIVLGLAAAFITPLSTSAFLVLFPDKAERTKAMAVLSSAMMLGLPLGPIVGGLLLDHFWWGSVFLINVPLVIIGVIAVAVLVPESRSPHRPAIDPLGVLGSSAGLVGLTYGVIQAGQYGWGDARSWIPLVAGVILLVALVFWERAVARRGEPLIDLTLFRSRDFSWGSILTILVTFAMMGLMFFLPQYYQAVQGSDALGTGLKLLPMIGGVLIGATLAGRVPPQTGPRAVPALGFLLTAIGLCLGAFTTVASGYGFTAIWLVLMGAGLGLAMTRTMTAALNALSTDRAGVGTGLMQALRQVGGTLGIALLGSLANAEYHRRLTLPPLPGQVSDAIRSSVSVGVEVGQKIGGAPMVTMVRTAYVGAMDTTLWICGAIAAVAAVLTALFLVARRQKGTIHPESPQGQPEHTTVVG